MVPSSPRSRIFSWLPGLTRDEIQLSVENGVLTITGEKREERTEGKPEGEVHLFERRYGRFERRWTLPTNVDADKIRARYENGVLVVTLPKTEEAKPRQIQIEAK
ncbi:MAG: Hsp20/alpha crystallin family protein [Gemmatimonadota bacterium]